MWEINTIQELWQFLVWDFSVWFRKRQADFLAFGKNHNVYSRWKTKKQLQKESNESKGYNFVYKNYFIPKKDGTYRVIKEPTPILKLIQKNILSKILSPFAEEILVENCTGFRKNLSIKDNANYHLNKNYIIKLDISDFFPSISQARVYGLFRKKFDFNHEISSYLSWFCTYENQLPQWAPTSPMLANIIWSYLDKKILLLLEKLNSWNSKLNLTYSRYADDLTFSYDSQKLNPNKLIKTIQNIIEEEGFLLNIRKIRFFSGNQKKEVTWIIVNNEKTSIWRKKYKFFRAIIHNINTQWWEKSLEIWNKNHRKKGEKIESIEKFQETLKWYYSFIKMVDSESIYLKDFESIL